MSESNSHEDQAVKEMFRQWGECPLCRKEIEEGQATKVGEISGHVRRVHSRCLATIQTFAKRLEWKDDLFQPDEEETENSEDGRDKTATRLTGAYRIVIMLAVLMAITLVLQFVLR